ncbi:MAG: RTX toxin [Shinella sp.]|nr:MAG: RTX toxin [Shinella sp.]
MSAINAFYRNANVSQYVTQLFTVNTPLTSSASSSARDWQNNSDTGNVRNEVAERAMARIIEIVTLGKDTSSAETSTTVSESFGHITGATGTSDADTLTMDTRSVYGIDMGAGDDVITARSDRVANISGGAGNDTFNISTDVANGIHGDDGDDTINISGKLVLDVDGGSGDDIIKVAADTIRGVTGGAGNDTMTLEGNRIYASGGTGDDTVTITQTGRNAVAEYGFAKGDGSDTITSNGALSIRFSGLTDKDVAISVSGTTLTAKVAGSDDQISLSLTEGDASNFSWTLDGGNYVLTVG